MATEPKNLIVALKREGDCGWLILKNQAYYVKKTHKVFNNHRVETSTNFQADQPGSVNLPSDIEPPNLRRGNLEGIDSGEYATSPSSCAAGSPTHAHKGRIASWPFSKFVTFLSKKQKQPFSKSADFFTGILGINIQRNACLVWTVHGASWRV